MEATAPDHFSEFASKVDQILKSSASRDDILEALRSLAEGKPAVLSGLGEQVSTSALSTYVSTMTRILAWGMDAFRFRTTYEGVHLWITMGMFDGPHGYNQL